MNDFLKALERFTITFDNRSGKWEVIDQASGEIFVHDTQAECIEHRIELIVNRSEAICNCEHISHFPVTTDPAFPDAPRDGHKYLTMQDGSHLHFLVGSVCTKCHETCLKGFD